jgi:hypothetical protein
MLMIFESPLVGLDELLLLRAVPSNERFGDTQDQQSHYPTVFLNSMLCSLLVKGESASSSLIGPNSSEDKPETGEDPMHSTIRH